MKLEKAIEILTLHYRGNYTKTYPDFGAAIQLSTEALKYLLRARVFSTYPVNRKLPGED